LQRCIFSRNNTNTNTNTTTNTFTNIMLRSFSQVELAPISPPDVNNYGSDYESYCKHYLLFLQIGSATGRELTRAKRVRSKRTTAYWFTPKFDVTAALKNLGVVFHDTAQAIVATAKPVSSLSVNDAPITLFDNDDSTVILDDKPNNDDLLDVIVPKSDDGPKEKPDLVEVSFDKLCKNDIFKCFAQHGVTAAGFQQQWGADPDLRMGNPIYIDTVCSIIAWKAQAAEGESVPIHIQDKALAWEDMKQYLAEQDAQPSS
jgi:hypothetical protein